MASIGEIFEKLHNRKPTISPKNPKCVGEFVKEALSHFGLSEEELTDFPNFKSKVQDVVSETRKRYKSSDSNFRGMMNNSKNTVRLFWALPAFLIL